MTDKTLDSNENNKFTKGDYEVFEVGDELVFSDDREKIKEYASRKGFDKIVYRMSSDNKEELEKMAVEV